MAKVIGYTSPHAAQEFILVEDAANPADRIYRVQDAQGGKEGIDILGSELHSLALMARVEYTRRPKGA